MIRWARLLPLVSVAAWALTLVVPIIRADEPQRDSIVVRSLGDISLDLTEASPPFVLAWAGVLACAGSVWLVRTLRWWSVVAMLVAAGLSALLINLLLDPPFLMWDGQDDQGRMVGGMVVGEPAAGALIWVIGILALFLAGVFGLVGGSREKHMSNV